MKSRKGFTIVELVIVIAVIAILAAVLIPTFSGVIQKANDSAALQQATSAMKSTLAQSSNATLVDKTCFVIGDKGIDYVFKFENDKLGTENIKDEANLFSQTVTINNEPKAFNTIVVPVENKTAASDAKTMALIKAITGGEADAYDATKDASAIETAIATYTVGEGESKVVWNIITNADFTPGIVVYTYSK